MGRESWIAGCVTTGHGVASGRSPASPYPRGTIELQRPCFLAKGLDLSAYHPATLNVDVAPHAPRPRHPVFDEVLAWYPGVQERFLLSHARLRVGAREYAGLWYYPAPETKPAHFQRATVVELLMPWIEGVAAGDPVQLALEGWNGSAP
ncbi:MAG: hypothetical protein AVDCRST_MAG51-1081 [uncultured Ramlibacter sp.]|uniref:Uncharacterized protein n=1 Tax=uncultured Ramlibacter sp. TaxID=260755 RepID=A0A6J4P4Y9_9BURK|nr:MAG: hypothetical protein AVDCRST_MAG51-1081 [uncultured Ramlibacter sp.]